MKIDSLFTLVTLQFIGTLLFIFKPIIIIENKK